MYRFIHTSIATLFNFIFPLSDDERSIRQYEPDELGKHISCAPEILSGLIVNRFPSSIVSIHAMWNYRDPLARAIIWQIKYEESLHAVCNAGSALSKYLKRRGITEGIILPIPLSRKRERERGYNQCTWIIEKCLDVCSDTFTTSSNILIRTEHRDRQTKKDRHARIENAAHIFTVTDAGLIYGKQCIVIDDVVTTGSTCIAASEALIEAGAARVICIALAH